MKTLFITAAFIATILSTGCAGPSYTSLNYNYQAPPEYTLTDKHKTIAYILKGKNINANSRELGHNIEGLTWSMDNKEANLLVNVKIKESKRYKTDLVEEISEEKNSEGKKVRVTRYSYEGLISTPYQINVYDNIADSYVAQIKQDYNEDIQGSVSRTERKALASLGAVAVRKQAAARKNAIASILKDTKRLLDVNFTTHAKSMAFRIPEKDEKEPRLAQAYKVLTTTPTKESAKAALTIYNDIGTANLDEDGDVNDDLNEGVYAGLSACHYILGDMPEYKRTKELANQFITPVQTTSAVYSNSSF